jgi:hypothetical protein
VLAQVRVWDIGGLRKKTVAPGAGGGDDMRGPGGAAGRVSYLLQPANWFLVA